MSEVTDATRRHFLSATTWGAGAAFAAGGLAPPLPLRADEAPAKGRHRPYVYVTLEGPEDGGDFGPRTPGTKTSGIQEALNYAHANFRDVYIFGGRGGLHEGEGTAQNVYVLNETLRVPWSQDFRLDGGNYLLAYQKTTGHAIHIDSQMNCRYKFGIVTSPSRDAAVCIRPETPGPDDFVVVTASVLDFAAVCSGHPEGTGILIDSSRGLIVNSKILAEEVNSLGIGVHVSDAGGSGHWIGNNQIQVLYGNQYHARGHSTGLRLGDPGTHKIVHNSLQMSFHAPRGAYFDTKAKKYVTAEHFIPEAAIGADIFAQSNALTLSFFGKRASGHDIVFEPEARDNTIFAFNLPNGMTNKATVPSNRIIPNWPVGFDVVTPPVPASGAEAVNVNPYSVQVIIVTPGTVSDWTFTDVERRSAAVPHNLSLVDNLKRPPRPLPPLGSPRSQTIAAGFTPGQAIILEPGERIKLTYAKAPTWRWKALA
jgi:hypothetical protein